jgi:hypothetical protein
LAAAVVVKLRAVPLGNGVVSVMFQPLYHWRNSPLLIETKEMKQEIEIK